LLASDGVIRPDDVLDAASLPQVQMPNRDAFVPRQPTWKKGEVRPFGLYK
jgi:hypothetical protein